LILGGYFGYVSLVNHLDTISSDVKNIMPDQTKIKDIVVDEISSTTSNSSNTIETITDTGQNFNGLGESAINPTVHNIVEFLAATATNRAIAQSGLESQKKGSELYQTLLNKANSPIPIEDVSATLELLTSMNTALTIVKDL